MIPFSVPSVLISFPNQWCHFWYNRWNLIFEMSELTSVWGHFSCRNVSKSCFAVHVSCRLNFTRRVSMKDRACNQIFCREIITSWTSPRLFSMCSTSRTSHKKNAVIIVTTQKKVVSFFRKFSFTNIPSTIMRSLCSSSELST